MARFFRVFGATDACPSESTVAGATFGREGDAWFWAELPGVRIDRFLAEEEGLRAELNSWAAVVEATLDEPAALMERIIQSRQLFVVQAEPTAEADAERVARSLAAATAGCYQVDEGGWHDADGTPLAGDEAA